MIGYILREIKKANRAVARGNIYRRKKYGEPETFAQSLEKAKAWRKWYRENCLADCRPMWPSNSDCEHWDHYKSRFHYWDCWTGGRYDRIENPNPHPDYEPGSICRSDPVTGKWYPR